MMFDYSIRKQIVELFKKKRLATANTRQVFLQYDNARPYTAKLSDDRIRELSRKVIPHPVYSPDMALSDNNLQNGIAEFLNSKPRSFYELPIKFQRFSQKLTFLILLKKKKKKPCTFKICLKLFRFIWRFNRTFYRDKKGTPIYCFQQICERKKNLIYSLA